MAWPNDNAASAPSGGVVVQNIRTVGSSGNILATDATILLDSSAGPMTKLLPAAASVSGQRFTLKKISSDNNAITIAGGVIDGDPDGVQVMAQYEALAVVSNGSVYYVLYRG